MHGKDQFESEGYCTWAFLKSLFGWLCQFFGSAGILQQARNSEFPCQKLGVLNHFSNNPSTRWAGNRLLGNILAKYKKEQGGFFGFHKSEIDWLVWQSQNLGKTCRAFQHCVTKGSSRPSMMSELSMRSEPTMCPKQTINPSLLDFKLQNTSYPRYKLQRRGQ